MDPVLCLLHIILSMLWIVLKGVNVSKPLQRISLVCITRRSSGEY